ncbi:uncharacterized protein LOC115971906 isoform X5 [Quercus lobata]|uniref:uncharacterized protein LOC115971906 isoform X5 n=1 Tax=Quercus lobata TaxID=97700 RepID=UPI00124648C2|nr:uncharacterized protein LOC115971906 isoform X5 [Quercus lobata]
MLHHTSLLLFATKGHGESKVLNNSNSLICDNIKEASSNNTVSEQLIPSKRTIPKKKSNGGPKQTSPRKRTGKKDRHSKICTAQGPRDRRMRLSLQIARKFFDLQDMLGFDKASKTIEWLFSKSKTAIKELTESTMSQVKQFSCSDVAKSTVSFTSESEVVSENLEIVDDGEFVNRLARVKKNRKIHRVARDSRDKARERARERTREKMIIRGLEKSKQSSEASPSNLGQVWSSTPLETGEKACFCSQEMKSSLGMMPEVEEPSNNNHLLEHQINSVSINEKILGIVGHNVTVSSGGNFAEDFPGFPVNWNSKNANMQSFCCRTTSMAVEPSTGDVPVKLPSAIVTATSKPQEMKPTSIFTTTFNAQEQMLSSIFMTTPNTTPEQSPSSYFITSSNSQHQNPTSNLLATSNNSLQSHCLENQFF